ncbi:CCR4-NOT transcription complex subunit 1-like protein [Tanacetum coccineum]
MNQDQEVLAKTDELATEAVGLDYSPRKSDPPINNPKHTKDIRQLHLGLMLRNRNTHLLASNASIVQNVSLSIFLVDAALDIFQTLIFELETEGRYLFLNVVANQLCYPNNHARYFSFILL